MKGFEATGLRAGYGGPPVIDGLSFAMKEGTLLGVLGAVVLLAADILARSVAATELPVSIFTSLIGAPFLISLIFRGRKSV